MWKQKTPVIKKNKEVAKGKKATNTFFFYTHQGLYNHVKGVLKKPSRKGSCLSGCSGDPYRRKRGEESPIREPLSVGDLSKSVWNQVILGELMEKYDKWTIMNFQDQMLFTYENQRSWRMKYLNY